MGKVFLAFVAGVALASLAFVFFDGAQGEQDLLSSEAPDRIREVAPMFGASATADEDREDRASAGTSDGSQSPESLAQCWQSNRTEEAAPEDLSACTDDELRSIENRAAEVVASMAEAERMLGVVQSEINRRRTVAMWAADPPNVPINLPPRVQLSVGVSAPFSRSATARSH